jgi:DNA-binding PadR family transcriptional regulator
MDAQSSASLLPFERALLAAVAQLEDRGETVIYGTLLARSVPGEHRPHHFMRTGWLYRALGHLVTVGLLESSMEDAATAQPHVGRRPRRLYRLTTAGRTALTSAPDSASS